MLVERSDGGSDVRRSVQVLEGLCRFSNHKLYLGGRYNTVRGKLARIQNGGGFKGLIVEGASPSDRSQLQKFGSHSWGSAVPTRCTSLRRERTMLQSALAQPSALARAPSIGLAMRPPSLSGEPPLNEMALRAPLAIKLAGANLLALVVVLAFFAVKVPSVGALATSLTAVLFAAVVAHFVLAIVALRPLRGLDTVVGRVRRGISGREWFRRPSPTPTWHG